MPFALPGQSIVGRRGHRRVVGGVVADPVAAYFATTPGSTDPTWRAAVTACIQGMVADGDWGGLDGVTFPAAGTDTYRNARNPAKTLTPSGTVTLTDYRGMTGDGSTGFVTIEVLNAAGNQYAQDSGMVAVYCNQENGLVGLSFHFGQTATARATLQGRSSGGNEAFAINDATSTSVAQASPGTRKGFRMAVRSDAANKRAFYNGVKTADVAVASTGVSPNAALLLRSTTAYSPDRIAGCLYGAGVTDAAALRLMARYQTCMAAIGANY